MMDILEQGSAGLDQLTERAERFGLTFSESQAQAIRRANFEWKGLSLAMEGIERQAAIMFAPLWEWLGKIGSEVGGYLVDQFKTFAEFVKVAMPDIQRVFSNLWEIIQTGIQRVTQFIQNAGAQWGLSFDSLADAGLTALATIVVVFEDLPRSWDVVKTALQIGWLSFLNFIKPHFVTAIGGIIGIWRSLPAVWDNVVLGLKRTFLQFLRDTLVDTMSWANMILTYTDPARLGRAAADAAAQGVNMHDLISQRAREEVLNMRMVRDWDNALRNLGLAGQNQAGLIAANIRREQERLGELPWLRGLDEQIDRLQGNLRGNLGDMGASIADLIERWRGAMRPRANPLAPPEALQPQSITMTRAISGHEAALEGGEKAFSLLFGSSSNQNFYQKATMEAVRRGNVDLAAMRRAFEQAPPIRRARV
jgi:hypothetical protein